MGMEHKHYWTIALDFFTSWNFFFSVQTILCWSLPLLMLAQTSDAQQQPGYLTVESSHQEAATIDSRKPVNSNSNSPEIVTTSSLPAASPAGMVTSFTDLSEQEAQEDALNHKLEISTPRFFPDQFQQQQSSSSYPKPQQTQSRTNEQDILPKVYPQYLTKSRTNNVKARTSLPTYQDEDEKMFPELLPVVTLVEKLQSQVLDLQRSRFEDRSQISQIQAQLSTQQQQILSLTSELIQLKETTVNHGYKTNELAKIIEEHKMSQKSLINMETELKVRLDDFVLSQRNVGQAMSAMKSSTQQLATKTDSVAKETNDMKKELEKMQSLSLKHSKAIKNLKKAMKNSAMEPLPENKKEDSLNMDLVVDEGLMVDVEANKLPQRVGNTITDLEHSGEGTMEDSASKSVPNEQLDESIPRFSLSDKRNESLFQDLKNHNQRLTKLYDMFFNLSLDLKNLKNQRNSLEGEFLQLQEHTSNLTERLVAIEALQISEGDPGSRLQASDEDSEPIIKMAANHTSRFRDMEHKLVMLQNNAFQKQHNSLQQHMLQLVNTSSNNLRRNLDQIQNKYDNKLNEKLKHLNREMHGMNDRVTSLTAQILNASLSHCQRMNNDLQQDIKLREAEKNIIRLKAAVSSNKDQIKRMEYRIYRMHHWIKNHTSLLDVLQMKTESLYEYLPMFNQVDEDIYNLRLHLPKDCSDRIEGGAVRSGPLVIYPRGSYSTVQVYCDVDLDGSWTTIQKRFNGSVDFNRTWEDYKYGFGSINSEFWLGNEFTHLLTSQDNFSLKIEMLDIYGKFWVAMYDSFQVTSESSGYILKVSSYSGNATDSLSYLNNSPFSTLDVDHDASSTHCAVHYTAGWWYRHCHYGNLNGRYKVGIVWFNQQLNDWIQMKSTVMKIKRNTASTSADQFTTP